MIEVKDTEFDAGEPASKARPGGGGDGGGEASRPREAFDSARTDGAPDASAAAAADSSSVDQSSIDRSSAARSSVAVPDAAHDTQPAPYYVEPLVLQPAFEAGDKSQYHVAELLRYHDRHFVESVYRALLGRAPYPAEEARELDDLRGGRAGKVEIIERLLSSPEARAGAGRRVRVEGLPSPALRRLGRVPVIGYLLRLARALVRLPVLMQDQQQFEAYALAQQQLIADYLNRTLAQFAPAPASGPVGATPAAPGPAPSQLDEIAETLAMFSDALIELSNSHAELQEQTRTLQEQTQTQVEQAQAALAELTRAITAQQHLAATLQREQQLAADAQREYLIHEQRVIVETQKVVLEELREELRELSARQQRARDEFDTEARRLRSLREAAPERENFSGQA